MPRRPRYPHRASVSLQCARVELLGEGRIRLFVSREYLEFARREGVECFIDFEWMRNAFIIDYLARELAAQGYTSGVLLSALYPVRLETAFLATPSAIST